MLTPAACTAPDTFCEPLNPDCTACKSCTKPDVATVPPCKNTVLVDPVRAIELGVVS